IKDAILPDDAILTHPLFKLYNSETDIKRYIHSLESKDMQMNQPMIPLGSCKMKLNDAAEMIPITWTEFSDLHPYCQVEQEESYQK
ncbi:hypothetical protein, partial [Klebsiella pneumoniae]|uniref:hypothetical protein n=1 Tax=Klebsiella pneumoniae TaxID=573 RepID=UPI00272F53AA